MKRLDVGCGSNAKGDVNLDLCVEKWVHRKENIDVRRAQNFVLGDANYLPFRDGVFEDVYSSHVLEHQGVHLVATCKEMLRVSNNTVTIRVPNLFRMDRDLHPHDKVFTVKAFEILFRNFRHKTQYCGRDWQRIYIPSWLKFKTLLRSPTLLGRKNPLHLLPCPIPSELLVVVWKQ